MSRQANKVLETKKISNELLNLTYGALVAQILKDYETDEEVNVQLDKMGYSIGLRIVEDYLAKTNSGRCNDLKEVADAVSKAFKMFVGINASVSFSNTNENEFTLILDSNPITEFVELPENHSGLNYGNILTGAIRGALKNVQLEVETSFLKDQLKGDNVTEIKVKFIRKVEDVVTGES